MKVTYLKGLKGDLQVFDFGGKVDSVEQGVNSLEGKWDVEQLLQKSLCGAHFGCIALVVPEPHFFLLCRSHLYQSF